uniref:Putative venom protein n=1 Tax=Superstitionia donensis TaxID=311983 RepID=A0A1V1WBE6_9SCOR
MESMIIIVTTCLIFDIFVSNGVTDDSAYLIFKHNTYKDCIIGENGCNLKEVQMMFLERHNFMRSRIAGSDSTTEPDAANMLMMEWDQSLANDAQNYAQNCLERGCQPEEAGFNGEVNIYTNSYDKADAHVESLPTRISNTIWSWVYDSVHGHSSEDIKSLLHSYKSDSPTMHQWANVIRATTWKMGCGIADILISPGANQFSEIIVCFYKNSKLNDGDELYKIGQPCTNCPPGTICSYKESLSNLCESIPGYCPITSNELTVEDSCYRSELQRTSIWNCSAEDDTENCRPERPCASVWKIDPYGKFKKITVSGMCTSANMYQKEIEINEPACFIFEYIKEPSVNQAIKSTVTGFVLQSNGKYSEKVTVSEDVDKWTPVKLDIYWTGIPLQIGISVRSRSTPTTGEQEIKIRNFLIVTGSCA